MAREIAIPIPAEHAGWFRRNVKEMMKVEAEDFSSGDEVSREQAVDTKEKASRYFDLLDQLGWSDDGRSKEVKLDAEFGKGLLKDGLDGLGEDMLVATGHYDSDSLFLDGVQSVASRAMWLSTAALEHGVGVSEKGCSG